MPLRVSIPNGKSGPLRPMPLPEPPSSYIAFQSQTGSQALSDPSTRQTTSPRTLCFNPKREVRPSQTQLKDVASRLRLMVSIPNGKSGPLRPIACSAVTYSSPVSIPNGKSGPLRRNARHCSSVAPLAFQSQTGSQALSDRIQSLLKASTIPVSIPNGKSGPLRPLERAMGIPYYQGFNPNREVRPSQTSRSAMAKTQTR